MATADSSISSNKPVWSLSTDAVSPTDRFDSWHAACSAFNDCRVAPEARSNFRAATECWPVGQFTLCCNESTPLRLFRSDLQASRDQLDHDVILVMLSGECRSETRGTSYGLVAGDIAVGNFRDGYDFRIISTEPARWIELICPPELTDRLTELGSGALGRGSLQTPQFQMLGQLITSVAQRLPHLKAVDIPLIEQALLCLLAAARRDPSTDPARLSETARQTVDRARAIALITRELSSARLTAERVCELTGISRSSLYRMFEIDGGVATYIRGLRLDALHRDLVEFGEGPQSIALLAESRGLYSPSTLNRAFRQRFGCTPGDLRTTAILPLVDHDNAHIGGMMDRLRAQVKR